MLKLVAFDLDDTLYPHKQYEFSAYKEISEIVSKKYNISSEDYYTKMISLFLESNNLLTFDVAIKNVLGYIPSDWEELMKKEILPVYRNHSTVLFPYNDMINFIMLLRNNKIKTVLVTNGNSSLQNNKINSLGVRHLFDKIYISDDFGKIARKPNLFMFKEFLKDFHLCPDECIYVGDNKNIDGVCEDLGIQFLLKAK